MGAAATPVLETDGLAVGYERAVIVKGVTLSVRPGEVWTLIGPNGAGKSTILKTLVAQLEPLGGCVRLDGRELAGIAGPELARTMAILTTERVRPELMNCGDVVAMGRYPHTGRLGLLAETDRHAIGQAMDIVGIADLAERPFSNVSDGQRQRVLLARAICQEPRILVLDEPTSYLDIRHKLEFLRIVRRLAAERQVAVLMSLHELELARIVSDVLVCVADGRIDRVGSAGEVFACGYIRRLYEVEDPLFAEVYPSLDAAGPCWTSGVDDEMVRSGQRRLRRGITTGTCAALATYGAARALLSGEVPEVLSLVTPKGLSVEVEPDFVEVSDHVARCGVKKDAGDDPDVTDGVVVVAEVVRAAAGIVIEGGEGVGRVTKPGLDQPVGAAAINRVPRQMIEEQARAAAAETGYQGGLAVTISIPGGTELAERTFNPQLGVVDGLSVLGTSGIEEPMSERALVDTIELGLRQARAEGATRVILVPGNYAEDFLAREMPELLELPRVKFANYLGDALDAATILGFEELLVVGHIGKLVKLAGGVMNTHSRVADCRLELMCAHAALAGASRHICQELMSAATTEAALDILREDGLVDPVLASLLEAMQRQLDRRVRGTMRVGAITFSNAHGLLGATEGARKLLKEWARTSAV